MLKKSLQLKLRHKVLAIVCIPIVFELLFLGMLWHLLQESEEKTLEVARSKQVIYLSNVLTMRSIDATASLLGFRLTKEQIWSDRIDGDKQDIAATLKEVEELIQSRPSQLATFGQIEETSNKAMKLLNSYENTLRGHYDLTVSLNLPNLQSELQYVFRKLAADLKEFIAAEENASLPKIMAESTARDAVKTWILCGVLMHVAFGIFLTAQFNRNTSRRLATLMDNLHKFSTGQQLNQPLTGTDELAELDNVFHQITTALYEAEAEKKLIEQAKREFVATISHELRTPLTSLHGVLALTLQGTYGPLSEGGNRRLQAAELSVERLIRLINELLDIEKMESGHLQFDFEEIDLINAIQAAVDEVRGFAEQQHVRLSITHTNAVFVQADKSRLIQVMINLLSNAIKFSPQQSCVEIVVMPHEQTVEVQVQDQGDGIAEQDIEKIFKKFTSSQSDSKLSGTGLGLPICQAIIEAHSGTIGVFSEPGKGSTFWFKLPAKLCTAPKERASERA